MNIFKCISFILLVTMFNCSNATRKQKQEASEAVQQILSNESVTDESVIYEAALNGDLSKVTELLGQDIDVNAKDQDERTALMYASFNGNDDIVKMLLDKGADVNVVDVNNRTALMFAASGPYPETVKMLLEHHAETDLTDLPEHFTALMYAAAEGQLEVVKVLLSFNANPSLKDVDGDNAVTFAMNNGHTEVAELLKSVTK